MSMTKTFMGWHKNCGGKVFRMSSGSIMQVTTCDKCASTSLNGGLSGNNIISDPYDSSVEDLIAERVQDDMNETLKYM